MMSMHARWPLQMPPPSGRDIGAAGRARVRAAAERGCCDECPALPDVREFRCGWAMLIAQHDVDCVHGPFGGRLTPEQRGELAGWRGWGCEDLSCSDNFPSTYVAYRDRFREPRPPG